jgi:hypothetical protein
MNRATLSGDVLACTGTSQHHSGTLYRWFITGVVLALAGPLVLVFCLLCILPILLLIPISLLWALVILLANIVSLCLGRFTPPFEHTPLSKTPHAIRLLKLQPGRKSDHIVCRLEEGPWSASTYEALSYTWGCELAFGRPSFIDAKLQPLTATLDRALRALRHETEVRTLWIDALCIDQGNNGEKSTQVQQMLKVYQHAERVVVWLDVDSWARRAAPTVELAFDTIRRYPADIKVDEDDASTQTLNTLFRLPYWERMWIIQEIAANRNVIVQCRDCIVDWETLCRFVLSQQRLCRLPDGLQIFMRRVDSIRDMSSPDPRYGLLSFIHDFRFSMATDPRDRLFALLGLVKAPDQLHVTVNYAATEGEVWSDFTKRCLERYRSLNAIAMTDSLDHVWYETGPTWLAVRFGNLKILSKRADTMTVRQPLWLGTHPAGERYAACGGLLAQCRTHLVDPDIIGVKGYIYDTIAQVHGVFRVTDAIEKQQQIIRQWWAVFQSRIADHQGAACRFISTITAGGSSDDALSTWLATTWNPLAGEHERTWATFASTIHRASNLRRIFVTETGVIGLAHSHARAGDRVCVLLGSAVPWVLRESVHDRPFGLGHPYVCWLQGCKRRKHLACCIPRLHRLVGQAYVHEVMHYQGDLEQDIRDGKRALTEFFIE